jgi:hypothetical protein
MRDKIVVPGHAGRTISVLRPGQGKQERRKETMKRCFAVMAVALVVCAALPAAAQYFTEDFEAGIGLWTPGSNGPLLWLTDVTDPNNKVAVQDNAARSMYRIIAPTIHVGLELKFRFYDPGAATNVRHFARLAAYSDPVNFTGLTELLAIGAYNTSGVQTNRYSGRAAFGKTDTPQGWFTIPKPRSVGWHNMSILITGDNGTGGPGKGLASFTVDDVTVANIPIVWSPFTMVLMGSNLSSATAGNYQYDDVQLVPEPASILALAAGLAGFAGVVRRRS